MKALVIILIVVAAICFFIEFIWSKSLGEREDKLKNDREIIKGKERTLEADKAHLKTCEEVYRREREQLKDKELSLTSRMNSALEFEDALDKRAEELAKKAKELEASAVAVEKQVKKTRKK